VTLVRILIWNLADSKTTLDELRGQLPPADNGDVWIGTTSRSGSGSCR